MQVILSEQEYQELKELSSASNARIDKCVKERLDKAKEIFINRVVEFADRKGMILLANRPQEFMRSLITEFKTGRLE
jgi:hypothetical protein